MNKLIYPATRGLGMWTPWPCWIHENQLKMGPEGWVLERHGSGRYRIIPRPEDIPRPELSITSITIQECYDDPIHGGAPWPRTTPEPWAPPEVKPPIEPGGPPPYARTFVVEMCRDSYLIYCVDAKRIQQDTNFTFLVFSPAESF